MDKRINDRQRVRAAFAQLRELGYVAKMNFMCCQNCARTQIAVDNPDATCVVTYNHQDNERSFPRGAVDLEADLYLSWSGDAHQIIRSLEAAGLSVSWSMHDGEKIIVRKVS